MRKSENRFDAASRGQHRKCAALSARGRGWQSVVGAVLALGALAAWSTAAPANARATGGRLGTLPLGDYACELPGSALGAAGERQPADDFSIIHASSYAVREGDGSYLLIGDLVQMTSGPRKGTRYRRISENFLRKLLPDGSEGPLRCVRGVLNNGG